MVPITNEPPQARVSDGEAGRTWTALRTSGWAEPCPGSWSLSLIATCRLITKTRAGKCRMSVQTARFSTIRQSNRRDPFTAPFRLIEGEGISRC